MIIEYAFKFYARYAKDAPKIELKDVFEASINSELGALQATLSLSISSTAFIMQPYSIVVQSTHFSECEYIVDEILSIDKNKKRLIASTPCELPKNISKYGDFSALGDVHFIGALDTNTRISTFDYESISDIQSKCESLGVACWADDRGIFLSSNFAIASNATPISEEINEDLVLSFNVSVSAGEAVDELSFNTNDENVYSEPEISLLLDPSPQPVTPQTSVRYTDSESGSVYVIAPLRAVGKIFFSQSFSDDEISVSAPNLVSHKDYYAVEEWSLEDDLNVRLSGFIKSLKAVSIDGVVVDFAHKSTDESGNFYYDNILCFQRALSGTLKVAYTTDILMFVCPPSALPKKLKIKASFKEASLEYTHAYEITDYYPKGYEHTFSLIKDFNLDSSKLSGKSLWLGDKTPIGVNAYGEAVVKFNDYGAYKLVLKDNAGVLKTMNVGYFANEFSTDFNEMESQ